MAFDSAFDFTHRASGVQSADTSGALFRCWIAGVVGADGEFFVQLGGGKLVGADGETIRMEDLSVSRVIEVADRVASLVRQGNSVCAAIRRAADHWATTTRLLHAAWPTSPVPSELRHVHQVH